MPAGRQYLSEGISDSGFDEGDLRIELGDPRSIASSLSMHKSDKYMTGM